MKQCFLCLDYSKDNICSPCKADLPWIQKACLRCGRYSKLENLCMLCLKQPSLWDAGHAPLIYQQPIIGLIRQLKFSRQFYQARILTDLFISALPSGPRPELLLPVPLHPWRMLWRGFNQSTELCKRLSSDLNIPYSPYYLKRNLYRGPQRGSNKAARKKNVNQAFSLIRPLTFSHIAIVDDVLTTGETLGEICRAIRLVHPEIHIDVWTMAQVILS